jgi:uncharacterized integral membrane protein
MSAAKDDRDISTSLNGDSAASPRSRLGGLWVTAVAFALVLLLLLIFILENSQRAEVSFFGAHGHLPMGVALLLAAVFGVLLVAVPGTARIVQLRLLGRRRPHRPLTAPVAVPTQPQPSDQQQRSGQQPTEQQPSVGEQPDGEQQPTP